MADAFVTGAGLFSLYMLGMLTGPKVFELFCRIVEEVWYWATEFVFWLLEIFLSIGDRGE
jgi:hypothetical protein